MIEHLIEVEIKIEGINNSSWIFGLSICDYLVKRQKSPFDKTNLFYHIVVVIIIIIIIEK